MPDIEHYETMQSIDGSLGELKSAIDLEKIPKSAKLDLTSGSSVKITMNAEISK